MQKKWLPLFKQSAAQIIRMKNQKMPLESNLPNFPVASEKQQVPLDIGSSHLLSQNLT